MQIREEMNLISCGIDQVNFKSEMVRLWREDREKRFEVKGSSDCGVGKVEGY